MNQINKFRAEVRNNIKSLAKDHNLQGLSKIWIRETARYRYAYNFTWLGRPIIQLPQDIVAMQEIIWQVKPTLIIETGIAHDGPRGCAATDTMVPRTDTRRARRSRVPGAGASLADRPR